MKYCPKCNAENRDTYLYCVECNTPLPKTVRLHGLLDRAEASMERGDVRSANKALKEYTAMSPGDRDAQFLYGITLVKLGLGQEARKAFEMSGVDFRGGECSRCHGSGRCSECGHTGNCTVCDGRGRCTMCNGTGKCYQCQGDNCPRCHGSGVCVRCKGEKVCVECGGSGSCPSCRGNDVCLNCGGTGQAMGIVESSVPGRYRKYIPR